MPCYNKNIRDQMVTDVSACRKSFAEFSAAAENKMEIIFDRGVYVGKNTSQAACVRVGHIVPQECAKQTAIPSVGKPRRGFSTV